jgi:hypothetical protein
MGIVCFEEEEDEEEDFGAVHFRGKAKNVLDGFA